MKFLQKTHYITLLKTAWKFCPRKKWRFALIYFLFFCANTISLAQPILYGWIINTIQEGGPDVFQKIAWLMLGTIGLEILFWSFHFPGRIIERELAFDVVESYRSKLFRGLCNLPLKWHHDHHSGNTISRAKKATLSLHQFTENQFTYIESAIRFIVLIVLFFFFIPKYAVFVLLASILLFFVTHKFDKRYAASLKETNEREHHMDAGFIDFISNAITLITLRVERLAGHEYVQRIRALFPPFRKEIYANEEKWCAVSIGVSIVAVLIILPYAYETYVIGDTVLLGGMVMLIEYTRRYVDVFYSFADKYERLVRNRTNLDALEPLWDVIEKNVSRSSELEQKQWHTIDIKNLFFRHEPDTDTHDLKNVKLSLQRGHRVALIGESGGGKSTLMHVLRGLYPPERIDVAFDGKKSPEAYRWLQDHTTLLPQDPEIFENTIWFNITLGLSVDKEQVDEMVRMARFDKVIERLPNGYQTDIRERGVNLSGGEKQRLALARGLLAAQHSDIVILDEPTSSVDMENEEAIFKAMFDAWPDKCFIASVHRLHLLSLFEDVYEMDGGVLEKKKS